MGSETKLSGPDLTQGVASDSLADGAMLVGHAEGEAVLLARRGTEVFAIGATCTHYGGPLGEGVFDGESVRCPWHHACFSLRTGTAEHAPALSAVACWKVKQDAGRIVVLGKRPTPKTPGGNTALGSAAGASKAPREVVIVGAGAAGHAAAEMLRREGFSGKLTLIGQDPADPVDRPNLSKDYLAGTAPEEWIPLRPDEFYAEHAIELVRRKRVERIEAASVVLEGGEVMRFDSLLLATGAEPVKLDIPGAGGPNVRYLRSLGDSRSIIEAAAGARRAVVIGGSFIGLEVAASLRARKLEVDVVALEALPLEKVFGADVGGFVKALHEEHGVRFHLKDTASAIDERGVTLKSGGRLEADLVIVGVGVRPVLDLAKSAGVTVDRGIVVDEYLETSRAGVYAAGDVARWPDVRSGESIRIEHWVVAQRQGQTAARNMLGQRVRFAAAPFFWSQHYDVPIAYVGHAVGWDRIDRIGSLDERNVALAYRKNGRTLAVASISRDDVSLQAEIALEKNDEAALERLIPRSG
jgi:NADPH-dependent 2,4-dienoyl-CoA reductase/sulfur reductase-like enzyme/nitrite reductase/ring-hydroxylating ferredoxin subunit